AAVVAVNWTAVGAIAAIAAVVVPLAVWLVPPAIRKLRDRRRRRETARDEYVSQVRVTARTIDVLANDPHAMKSAQKELKELRQREERVRIAFGPESAVHWIVRLNRGMLAHAYALATASPPAPGLGDLTSLGIDWEGLRAFEDEVAAAMGRREPVYT